MPHDIPGNAASKKRKFDDRRGFSQGKANSPKHERVRRPFLIASLLPTRNQRQPEYACSCVYSHLYCNIFDRYRQLMVVWPDFGV